MSITLNDGAATFYPYIYVIITSYARWMNSVTSEAICPAIKKNVRNVFSWKKIVEFDSHWILWLSEEIRLKSAPIILTRTYFYRVVAYYFIFITGIKRILVYSLLLAFMVTSSNGNIYAFIIDPLCREFTGHRWIPRTKASDAEPWCFLWSAPQ